MSACNSTVVGGGGTEGGILEFQSTPPSNLHESKETRIMTFFYNIKISLYFNKNTVKKGFCVRAREKKNNKKRKLKEKTYIVLKVVVSTIKSFGEDQG